MVRLGSARRAYESAPSTHNLQLPTYLISASLHPGTRTRGERELHGPTVFTHDDTKPRRHEGPCRAALCAAGKPGCPRNKQHTVNGCLFLGIPASLDAGRRQTVGRRPTGPQFRVFSYSLSSSCLRVVVASCRPQAGACGCLTRRCRSSSRIPFDQPANQTPPNS
jgi:hypothetical protein